MENIKINTTNKENIGINTITNKVSEVEALTMEILQLKRNIAENIIGLGTKLIKVKESLGHGEWLPYLENEVDFSRQTANKFMKISTEFKNVHTSVHLGSEKLYALITIPKEERVDFMDDNDIENMSTRELTKVIKEFKESKKTPKEKPIAEKEVNIPKVEEKSEPIEEPKFENETLDDTKRRLKQKRQDVFDRRHAMLLINNQDYQNVNAELDDFCDANGLYDQMDFMASFVELVSNTHEFLQHNLSIFIYHRALLNLDNPIVKENILDIIHEIDKWSVKMKKEVEGEVRGNCETVKTEIIEAEIIDEKIIEVNSYDKVKADIHNVESNVESKVDTMSVEQLIEMEKELESHEKAMKELKDRIVINKFKAHEKLSKDYKIEIEESIEGFGTFYTIDLFYSIYIIRDDKKVLILDKINSFSFRDLDISKSYGIVMGRLNTLLKDSLITKQVYESVLLRCEYLKTIVENRWEELYDESKREYRKNNGQEYEYEESEEKAEVSTDNIKIKATLKKFYSTLAMKFHPDCGGNNEEMALVNELKKEWGID